MSIIATDTATCIAVEQQNSPFSLSLIKKPRSLTKMTSKYFLILLQVNFGRLAFLIAGKLLFTTFQRILPLYGSEQIKEKTFLHTLTRTLSKQVVAKVITRWFMASQVQREGVFISSDEAGPQFGSSTSFGGGLCRNRT